MALCQREMAGGDGKVVILSGRFAGHEILKVVTVPVAFDLDVGFWCKQSGKTGREQFWFWFIRIGLCNPGYRNRIDQRKTGAIRGSGEIDPVELFYLRQGGQGVPILWCLCQ